MHHADTLSPAERAVLEALNAEGTRWHTAMQLAIACRFTRSVVASTLPQLQRRELATSRMAGRHTFVREWTITTEGATALTGHEQLRLA